MGALGACREEMGLVAIADAGIAAVLLGRHLSAGLGEEVAMPLDDLTAALGPSLKQLSLRTQIIEEHEVAHKTLARGVIGLAVQANGGKALRRGKRKLLKKGDLGSKFCRMHGSSHTGLAGANHDDIVIGGASDIRDRLGLNKERRRILSGRLHLVGLCRRDACKRGNASRKTDCAATCHGCGIVHKHDRPSLSRPLQLKQTLSCAPEDVLRPCVRTASGALTAQESTSAEVSPTIGRKQKRVLYS